MSISIGLVVKILWDPDVNLDGDGGFSVRQCGQHYIFKPISVQALWTIIQTLHMIAERLTPKPHSLIERQLRSSTGPSTAAAIQVDNEDWAKEYERRISSSQSCLNEWHEMPDLIVRRPRSPDRVDGGFLDREGMLTFLCSYQRSNLERYDSVCILGKTQVILLGIALTLTNGSQLISYDIFFSTSRNKHQIEFTKCDENR